MGLDMYAEARMGVGPECPRFGHGDVPYGEMTVCTIDGPQTIPGMDPEFAYWRKHPDLHGWMERLARSEGFEGDWDAFNGVWLRLTPQDLDRLSADMETGLETVTGFFFGASTPESAEYTRKFIKGARYAYKKGVTIFYNSSW